MPGKCIKPFNKWFAEHPEYHATPEEDTSVKIEEDTVTKQDTPVKVEDDATPERSVAYDYKDKEIFRDQREAEKIVNQPAAKAKRAAKVAWYAAQLLRTETARVRRDLIKGKRDKEVEEKAAAKTAKKKIKLTLKKKVDGEVTQEVQKEGWRSSKRIAEKAKEKAAAGTEGKGMGRPAKKGAKKG